MLISTGPPNDETRRDGRVSDGVTTPQWEKSYSFVTRCQQICWLIRKGDQPAIPGVRKRGIDPLVGTLQALSITLMRDAEPLGAHLLQAAILPQILLADDEPVTEQRMPASEFAHQPIDALINGMIGLTIGGVDERRIRLIAHHRNLAAASAAKAAAAEDFAFFAQRAFLPMYRAMVDMQFGAPRSTAGGA
jgi:hypothetical protein